MNELEANACLKAIDGIKVITTYKINQTQNFKQRCIGSQSILEEVSILQKASAILCDMYVQA